MAREQRKDVDYFPHDCTHGRKMHIIETKYGNDGYATWFKLLEQLGKANNHYIDVSDEMTLMFLVSLFKIDEEKTLLILGDLAKLGSIDKTLYEQHKIIFSKKFTDSIQDAYRKRKLECFQYSDILAFVESKNAQSGGRLTEDSLILSDIPLNEAEVIPKVKDSIVNKSIEEESKGEDKIVNLVLLPNKEKIDFQEIVDIFNSVCIELPKVTKIIDARKKAITKILEKNSLEELGTVFRNISESDYLNGKIVTWKADFDWILKPENFIKILENKYKNNSNGRQNNNQQPTIDERYKDINDTVDKYFG